LKDLAAKAAAAPLIREPGVKFQYNNTGINVGGRIIEVVSGMEYTDFMQKRLFDPLGMKDTTFWPTEAQARRLARTARFTADKSNLEEVKLDKNLSQAFIDKLGHGVSVPEPMLSDLGMGVIFDYANHYGQPAGGLYSTARDVGKVCQMLLNGGVFEGKRYLSEEAIKQMTSIQTGDIMVNPDEGYGVGWFVKKKDNEGPSPGSFGHRGARRTVMWVDPANQLVMVLLVERFDMTGDQQKQLYPAFMRTAIARFGKGR
jgi:CubicO group peptidase (beta-lactamase class C family)